ncbi:MULTISPECIES: nuclear transport factor 2 family protein [unclassified Mycobacterium]|uniref:nuclear transport factor 2 family protein n=1 Tax=unclassified Mycobacterium TaxID=2642494 RepID=UPI0007400A69|nr:MULTISPECIES: nuclear transport factor 2 family protein [unclassified Mycobacterium]KUH80173.1 polyketide cyclase [Mycobacterium sp. GA-0227b]KUH81724.1 polyketide cyclase [Mycobacterium sp. GA-1999]KUH94005.1 polyketide cyclase [Mycobacterium sp. IS-1556]
MDDDKAQIAEVLIRYATGIDSKDWALFRTCWTDEVDIDYGDLGTFTDADAFTALMEQIHGGMGQTYHRISNIVIDVTADRATARSYVHAVLMAVPGDGSSWIDALGHYDDELTRAGDGWRIVKRTTNIARVMSPAQ